MLLFVGGSIRNAPGESMAKRRTRDQERVGELSYRGIFVVAIG